MTVVQKLAELGFKDVIDHGTKNGATLIQVMTNRGWAYERFKPQDDVAAWAKDKVPE